MAVTYHLLLQQHLQYIRSLNVLRAQLAASMLRYILCFFFSNLLIDRQKYRGIKYLVCTQNRDGTWKGNPEMYGPRPMVCK